MGFIDFQTSTDYETIRRVVEEHTGGRRPTVSMQDNRDRPPLHAELAERAAKRQGATWNYPYVEESFGDGRVALKPIAITAPHRYGFFIHGGTAMGTSGCIKLLDSNLHAFVRRLQYYGGGLELRVEYPEEFKRRGRIVDIPKIGITTDKELPKWFRPLDPPEW
jgi:hypothetical protein